MRLWTALANRLITLNDESSEYFWKERPWYEDDSILRGEPILKWEKEKAKLKLKTKVVLEKLDKLYFEMYPKDKYPKMHDNYQPSIFDKSEPPIPTEKGVVLTPDTEPLEYDEMVCSAREVFAEQNNTEISSKGLSILEAFNRRISA